MAQSGEYDREMFEMIPFTTMDGINDAGLCINVNIVSSGETNEDAANAENTEDDIRCLMILRLVLDHAATVEEAIDLMGESDLCGLPTMSKVSYMISGARSKDDPVRSTVVVDFIPDAGGNHQLSIIGDDENEFVDNKMIMTNFHLTGYDGTTESLPLHPVGWERYQILSECYEMGKTEIGMADLMKKVYSTRCYDLYMGNFWYSEYAYGDLTRDNTGESYLGGDMSRAGAYENVINEEQEAYLRGERDSSYWQTVHCSVYNLDTKTLTVRVQEGSVGYKYTLEEWYRSRLF